MQQHHTCIKSITHALKNFISLLLVVN